MSRKKKDPKTSKSYLVRVMVAEKRPPLPVYILLEILAFILDFIHLILSFIAQIFLIALIIILVVTGIAYYKISPVYKEYMSDAQKTVDATTPNTFRFNETTVIYNKNKKKIAELSKDSNTVYLSYDAIPTDVVNAFIAVEDRTFWENPGIDYKGIVRVIVDAVKTNGQELHGASTITQQLAKNIFLNGDITLDRKLREMAIAVKLTEKYSKEQIMEYYVNNVYFANGYYGVEAAANGYFRKSVKDCSLSQIAYLCAIPNSPTFFDPRNDPDRAIERRDLILKDMYELEAISYKQYQDAINEPIEIEGAAQAKGGYDMTYAADCAVRYFMKLDNFKFQYHFNTHEEYDEYQTVYAEEYEKMRRELYEGGYRVYTSLDSDKQKMLQTTANEYIAKMTGNNKDSDLQTAMVLCNEKGQVSAIIGGTDQVNFGLNRAYQSFRQPGSTIKPLLVYTPALMNGYTQETYVKNVDVTTAQRMSKEYGKQGKIFDITTMNASKVTLKYGLEQSLNGVAYYLYSDLGAQNVMHYLEDMQMTKIVPEDYTVSSSLGGLTFGVTPVEMAGGYACLANDGMYNEPTCITSIIDRYGNERYKAAPEVRVYEKSAADGTQEMMEGVMKSGTAAALRWYNQSKVPAYVKTGTTNDQKDGWMCGWTQEEGSNECNVLTVWVGHDIPKKENWLWGSTAGQEWMQAMLGVLVAE